MGALPHRAAARGRRLALVVVGLVATAPRASAVGTATESLAPGEIGPFEAPAGERDAVEQDHLLSLVLAGAKSPATSTFAAEALSRAELRTGPRRRAISELAVAEPSVRALLDRALARTRTDDVLDAARDRLGDRERDVWARRAAAGVLLDAGPSRFEDVLGALRDPRVSGSLARCIGSELAKRCGDPLVAERARAIAADRAMPELARVECVRAVGDETLLVALAGARDESALVRVAAVEQLCLRTGDGFGWWDAGWIAGRLRADRSAEFRERLALWVRSRVGGAPAECLRAEADAVLAAAPSR